MSVQREKPLTVIVGEGTCGIAAGAKEVYTTFRSLVPDAEMKTVGCVGMCHQAVMVEIIDGKGEAFLYGKVDKKNIPSILGFHKGEGELQFDHLIRSGTSMNGADYLARQTRIVLRNVGQLDPKSLEEYRKRGGYQAIEKILKGDISPEQVIDEVSTAGIRGRGGAGFPTAVKWNFARSARGDEKYLICNGDEGDPGAFMDRSLLEGDPHSVLEGMLIAAYAIGASRGYAYIRAEYPLAVEHFGKAIRDAREAGFLGKNILGHGFDFDVKIKQGAGAFVCGE